MTTGAALILTCAAYFTYEFFTFREEVKTHLNTIGKIVASNSTAALAFESRQDANEILSALKGEEHIVAACLFDASGAIFARYPANMAPENFPVPPNGKANYEFGNGYVHGYEPVIEGNKRLGTLYLRSDLGVMYARLRLYGMIAFLVIACSFLFAYFLSRRLQASISKPVLNLAETARIVSERYDYSVRAVRTSDDELGLLTDAFNHMLTQIELQNSEILLFNQKLEQKVIERTNDLRAANSDLKLQNEFVETIIDSSVHMITVLDRDMRFTTMNNQCAAVYHVNKEEVMGKRYDEVFPQAKDSPSYRDIQRALKGEYIHNPFVRSVVVNGYFENYFIPLRQNNVVYGVLILAHDITAIMDANDKLKILNEQLVKSNQDLEQFAYVASHDLQEPLRKIQTFAQLAQKEVSTNPGTQTYLEKIASSGKRMTDLINAVLNYSRLSKNREQFEPVDLNSLVTNIRTDLELMISEKNATITSDVLPVIEGIALQLSQLFFNLVGNSLKFSDRPPAITIQSTILKGKEITRESDLLPNEAYVELIFSDNGVGFEQQYADRIFTIFQRLHDRQSYTGTGIGLALCKKIVENHNGRISAESEPGKGARFYIYLPLRHVPLGG
ncbi:MAG: hypothetical protein JWQ78_1483 [Sediminibacterium sp.]|nr:hypothetical protein [Sediminibacterium sp.]